jgi:hypothetical protein
MHIASNSRPKKHTAIERIEHANYSLSPYGNKLTSLIGNKEQTVM